MKKFFILLLFIFIINPVFAENLLLLHTSDIHGRLAPVDVSNLKNVGGFARRVSYFNSMKTHNKNVFIIDSGDYFQGSIYYNLDKGKLSAKLMPLAKYDFVTLGNHEFDDGLKILKRNLKLTKTPVLCANIEFKDKYLQKRVMSYALKNVNGKKVLFIGVVTSDLSSLSSSHGIEIKKPEQIVKEILSKVDADSVIIISHCGLNEDEQILAENPRVNLILGGHNHLIYSSDDKKIYQDGSFGIYVGKYEFDIDCGVKNSSRTLIDDSIIENIIVNKKIAKVDEKIGKLNKKVLARTNVELIADQNYIESHQANLPRLILKSMALRFPEYDAVLIQAGSIRLNKNLSSQITNVDVMELLPFKGGIVFGEIEGRYLKQILKKGKNTGRGYMQYYIKPVMIEDDKLYKIVTSEYLAQGKDKYVEFRNMKILKTLNETSAKIFKDFLKHNKNINQSTFEMT